MIAALWDGSLQALSTPLNQRLACYHRPADTAITAASAWCCDTPREDRRLPGGSTGPESRAGMGPPASAAVIARPCSLALLKMQAPSISTAVQQELFNCAVPWSLGSSVYLRFPEPPSFPMEQGARVCLGETFRRGQEALLGELAMHPSPCPSAHASAPVELRSALGGCSLLSGGSWQVMSQQVAMAVV